MKRYNLSKIMRRAWELIKREIKFNMSDALKMAWHEAKVNLRLVEKKNNETVKKVAEDVKESGMKIVDWFQKKKFDDKGVFLKNVIGIEKETEKACLLKVEVVFCSSTFTDTAWVPKSCMVSA